jgi:hypothetical protein
VVSEVGTVRSAKGSLIVEPEADCTAKRPTSVLQPESSLHAGSHGETATAQYTTLLQCLQTDATDSFQFVQTASSRQRHICHLRLEAAIQIHHHLLQRHTLRLVDRRLDSS